MSPRRIALEAFLDITDRGAYANLRLKSARQQAQQEKDAQFITALVYETLDHLLYIDHVLSHFAKGRQKPVIRGILRMGVCQMLFMDTPVSAACNESVKIVKQIGKAPLAGYVNGVLRAIAKAVEENTLPEVPKSPTAERLSITYSWPRWLVEEWLSQYGEGFTTALLDAFSHVGKGISLRAQLPYTKQELKTFLEQKGIVYQNGSLDPVCFHLQSGQDILRDPLFLEGKITLQSESAMLVCRALGIQPGMRVLDACAAPGGKSAYLWELAKGQAELTAWELHPHRRELMNKTFQRLHVKAKTRVQDAAVFLQEAENAFDAVLLDVPCSGLGVAKPDVRYAKSSEAVEAIAKEQARILNTCARYVKPGGVLLYATCTISQRENQQQVAAFLEQNPAFRADSLIPYLPGSIPGLETGMVQLFPNRDGAEGFFIARMVKNEIN